MFCLMRILYLTSTFQSEWNRKYNEKLAAKLEQRGLNCYFAHKHTNQTGSRQEKFDQDIAGIQDSEMVLAIAKNETPNWGGEVGFAYGRKMPVIALTEFNH